MNKSISPSLPCFGNLIALFAINGILIFAFIDQLIFNELPCPLCLMQRMGFVIVGFVFVMNLRCGAYPANYGWGLLGGLVGMMVSLRQVLLHISPGDKGFGATFLELHFYTWAFIGFIGLLFWQSILLMLPSRDVRSHSWFSNGLIIIFGALVFGNLVSTLLECGIGVCADNPLHYDGLNWLRSRVGF